MSKINLKNPRKAWQIEENTGTAIASSSFKAVLSTLPDVISIYQTSEG